MKKILYYSFALFFLNFPLVFADNLPIIQEKINVDPIEDEIAVVERLVKTTEMQLEAQKKLKVFMIEFKKQKDVFIKGNQSKKHASLMVITASRIFDLITTNHLNHLFTPEYLEELALFTSIANKHRPATP